MKGRFARWLSALLVATLLLTPVAMMEETIEPETGFAEAILSEAVDARVEAEAAELADEEALFDLPLGEDDVAEAAAAVLPEDAGVGIPIDAAHFPDEKFRAYLVDLEKEGDSDIYNHDGCLSDSEIKDIYSVYLSDQGVASLAGIEYLTGLKELFCEHSSLTSVDLSSLKNLVYVSFDFSGSLTSLTVGALPNLRALSIIKCEKLASVDVSGCPTLLASLTGEPVEKTEYWSSLGMEITYLRWGWVNKEESHCINYSANTRIITKAGTTPSTPSDPTPSGGTSTITVQKKTSKATATVGNTYQIDLGGNSGKGYKSSKKKVATVTSGGLISARAAGTAKISFKVGKKKYALTLKVVDPTIPTGITLSASGPLTGKKGETVTLTAVLPEGTVSGIKWKSSNKKVATVSNGVVTFKKPGKAVITATCVRGKKKAKVKVKVTK